MPLEVTATDMASIGLMIETVDSPQRGEPVEIHYWYPAAGPGTDFVFGGNKIFEGSGVGLDAAVAAGTFPVVLLAHGGLRASAYHAGWVASGLARRGFIVIVPQPPRYDRLQPEMAPYEPWLRPSDLSLGLSHLEIIPSLKGSADSGRVYGVGFFLGGTSVLVLAGAEYDPRLYKQSCEIMNVNIDCAWLRKNHVDLREIPEDRLPRSIRDNRIKSVVAINPELTKIFKPSSLSELPILVGIIELRGADSIDTGFELAETLRNDSMLKIRSIPGSNAYSAFSACTPAGAEILAAEGEDNLCLDPPGSRRQDVHRSILAAIERFLVGE